MAGSIFGAFSGLFSWIFFDTSALNAFGLYFSVSLVSGLLPILFATLRGSDVRTASAVVARS
ncbi:hypothetical protein IQ782_12025 [Salipiger pacificus]|uniref:Uncharacterized protein n=2 Tax=Salipiger mangrovisoli TaxID=2865933 RepID=A0ABR9X1X6_9RHOB|nr:hypothetical protein [Salipiger mangrovisoli]